MPSTESTWERERAPLDAKRLMLECSGGLGMINHDDLLVHDGRNKLEKLGSHYLNGDPIHPLTIGLTEESSYRLQEVERQAIGVWRLVYSQFNPHTIFIERVWHSDMRLPLSPPVESPERLPASRLPRTESA